MKPEHCPNKECPNFSEPAAKRWFSPHGHHKTKAFGEVPRYQCKTCGRTFSDQTFSLDYCVKIKVDYDAILNGLKSASGNLDLARELKVRDEVVQNRIDRLARWAQGIHAIVMPQLTFQEDLAADGLESFSFSQYFPNNINIIAGRKSQYLYGCSLSLLRRKGRMTAKQKEKRSALEAEGKAHPRDTFRSMKALACDLAKSITDRGLTSIDIWTDEHKAYPRAFAAAPVFNHHTISSKEARTTSNPLFAVNYLDREARKDLSDHTRETVQFAHHPACMMNRLMIYRYHHNLEKPFRIKEYRENSPYLPVTHGAKAGLDMDAVRALIQKMKGRRFFLSKLDLKGEELKTWSQEWKNPGTEESRYTPKYIYM